MKKLTKAISLVVVFILAATFVFPMGISAASKKNLVKKAKRAYRTELLSKLETTDQWGNKFKGFFKIVDLDGDKIPECILEDSTSPESGLHRAYIYSYIDKELKVPSEMRGNIIKQKGLYFVTVHGAASGGFMSWWDYSNGSLVLIAEAWANGVEPSQFFVNDIRVDESEYISFLTSKGLEELLDDSISKYNYKSAEMKKKAIIKATK